MKGSFQRTPEDRILRRLDLGNHRLFLHLPSRVGDRCRRCTIPLQTVVIHAIHGILLVTKRPDRVVTRPDHCAGDRPRHLTLK